MAYRLFPLENFVDLLAFDSLDQAMAFLRVIPAANLDAQDPNFIAGTRETLVPSTTMPQLSCAWIEAKATGMTLSQVGEPFNDYRSIIKRRTKRRKIILKVILFPFSCRSSTTNHRRLLHMQMQIPNNNNRSTPFRRRPMPT